MGKFIDKEDSGFAGKSCIDIEFTLKNAAVFDILSG